MTQPGRPKWVIANSYRVETDGPIRWDHVKIKIAEIKHHCSSSSFPVCLRCTERGHLATACHNAVLCFVCNRLDYHAVQFRTVNEHFSLPPTSTLPPTPSQSENQITSPGHLACCFLSSDEGKWGLERVRAALIHLMPHFNCDVL